MDAAAMRVELRALLDRHCATIVSEIGLLRYGLARLEAGEGDRTRILREAHEVAHRLKGGSGSIGFHAVSAAATCLDDCLKSAIAGGPESASDTDRELRILLDDLARLGEALTPESSALYNVDLSRPR